MSDMNDFLVSASKKLSKKLGSDVDLSKATEIEESKRIPTGIYSIDRALMGGFPEGKFSIIAGRYHSCKSSLLCKLVANAQRKYPDKVAIYVDMEDHWDPKKAQDHGVDLERVKVVQLYTAGEVTDFLCEWIDDYAHVISIIAIDSLSSCTDIRMLTSDKGADGHHIANLAKPLSTMLNFLEASLRAAKLRKDERPAIVGANHYRVNMDAGLYGPKIKLAGGDIPSQRSYLTLLLDPVANPDHLGRYDDENEEQGYITIRAKFHKCKLDVNPPKAVDFSMCIGAKQKYPPGTIDPNTLVKRLVKEGYLTRNRVNPKLQNLDIDNIPEFEDREHVCSYLVENPDIRRYIESVSIQDYRESKNKPRINPSENFMIEWVKEDNAAKKETEEVAE